MKSFAQKPIQVQIGIWGGGRPMGSRRYIDWIGGYIDYSKLPYSIVVEGIKVADYSTGQLYKYTELDGSWKSIDTIGGDLLGPMD